MKYLHTEEPVVLTDIEVLPFDTLFHFDASELEIVERILEGMVGMYADEDQDDMYKHIVNQLQRVRANRNRTIQ